MIFLIRGYLENVVFNPVNSSNDKISISGYLINAYIYGYYVPDVEVVEGNLITVEKSNIRCI